MTEMPVFPVDHRATAEALMAKVYSDGFAPMHPFRVDMIARATVHALLAVEPAERPQVIYVNLPRDIDAAQLADLVAAAGGAVQPLPEHAGSDPVADLSVGDVADGVERLVAVTAPRKRAAKKTTTTKETSK